MQRVNFTKINLTGRAERPQPASHGMKKGQGLLETIVALGIIMTGLMATITLVISNLRAQRDSASRLVAVNLAREGVEVVRAIRDTNWLAGSDTWAGILRGSDTTAVLQFEPSTLSYELNYDPSGIDNVQAQICKSSVEDHRGVYVQPGPCGRPGLEPTRFRRLLNVTSIKCRDDGALSVACVELGSDTVVGITVNSAVRWDEGGQTKNVEIIEKLYDWR